MGDEFGLGGDDALEEGEVLGWESSGCFGVVAVNCVVGEGTEGIVVLAGCEVLEGADANVAGGDSGEDPSHDGAFLTVDGLAGGYGGEGSGCRNTEGVHRFADDVFADDGAKGGFAVAATGEVGGAGAFKLDIARDRRRWELRLTEGRGRRQAGGRSRRIGGRRRLGRGVRHRGLWCCRRRCQGPRGW